MWAEINDSFERAVIGLVRRSSGRTLAVIAVLLYPGIGLIVPILLHWPVIGLVYANLVGVTFAAIVGLGWMAVQIDAGKRRHLVDWTTDLRLLDADEFEWFVGETFRREGWVVQESGHQDKPDGNIDLELRRDGQRKIVQCKRWTARRIGVDEIRAFGGTLFREGLPRGSGIFVTLSDFHEQARVEAKSMGVTLVGGRELFERVERVRRPEPCPICRRPMRFDRSLKGWWFRCVAPGCPGKRDLGGQPGRAIELMTEPPPSTS